MMPTTIPTKLPCICQICTCGNHRCPADTNAVPQKYGHWHAGQMAKDTTHRRHYKPHRVEKRQQRAPEVYQKPEGHVEDLSSYRQEYIKKDLTITKGFKVDEDSVKVPGEFSGIPTYKADYRWWTSQPAERAQKDDGFRPLHILQGALKWSSNYNDDYITHMGATRHSLKPRENTGPTGAPFDETTSYKLDFWKKPLSPRKLREKPQWVPGKAVFQGNTNYNDDFTPKPTAVTALPMKQAQTFSTKWDSGRFEDDTTYKGDFVKKPIRAQRVEKKFDYTAPDVPFQGNSSYTDSFVKHPEAVRPSLKPRESVMCCPAASHTNLYRKDMPPCNLTMGGKDMSKNNFED